jgi:hypothetical protein
VSQLRVVAYIVFKACEYKLARDLSRKSHNSHNPEASMNIHLALGPLLSLIAGILIFIVPRLLNYIVAIYLIAMGLIGLFGTGAFR